MALKRICPKCGDLIPMSEKMCEKCMPKYLEDKKISNKIYDKKYRDKKSTAFYHSEEWEIRGEEVKQRDNGLCQLCLKDKRKKYMDMVHHIVELKEDWTKRLDKDNLVSLCNSCHNAVHGEYDKGNKVEMQKELRGLTQSKKMYFRKGRGYLEISWQLPKHRSPRFLPQKLPK